MSANRFRFRAWDANTRRMKHQDDAGWFWGCAIDGFDELQDVRLDTVFRKASLIPMQSTGLLDANGVEIFEGDVVEFTYWWFDGNVAESQLTGEIVYSPQVMSFQLKGVKNAEWQKHTGFSDGEYLTPFSELTFDEADFRVIGNIHQDGHLLEAQP